MVAVKETGSQALKRWRAKAGISTEELAVDVGVTEGAAWQWEDGRTTPRRAVALKVDKRLGAGGEVASAFGYALERDPAADELTQLRDEIESLRQEVRRLAKAADETDRRVEVQGDAIARIEAQLPPGGAQSGR